MISVHDALPSIIDGLISAPVIFIADGARYTGIYHENGWFYTRERLIGHRGANFVMAKGPKASCRCSSWDELPRTEATEWEYVSHGA